MIDPKVLCIIANLNRVFIIPSTIIKLDVVNNDAALQNAYMNLKNSMGLVGKDIDFGIDS